MAGASDKTAAAVLVSGGIESSVLAAELSGTCDAVFPLFLRGGLRWEDVELECLRSFLAAIARPSLRPLTVLDQPVQDVYGSHWSTGGRDVPAADSPDEAVFLPGRNLFLLTKASVWCALGGVPTLALGTLKSNPFADSTPEFDRALEQLVLRALGTSVRIVRPFADLTKPDVLRRGAKLPLERTFSCIQPVRGLHCGTCNKCAERRAGFAAAGLADRTRYADRL